MSRLIDFVADGNSAQAVASAFLDLVAEGYYSKIYERHPLTGDFLVEAKKEPNLITHVERVDDDAEWTEHHKNKSAKEREEAERRMKLNGRVKVQYKNGEVRDHSVSDINVHTWLDKHARPSDYQPDANIWKIEHHPTEKGKYHVYYHNPKFFSDDKDFPKRIATGEDFQVGKWLRKGKEVGGKPAEVATKKQMDDIGKKQKEGTNKHQATTTSDDTDEPKIVYPKKPELVKPGAKEKLAAMKQQALAGKPGESDHDKVQQQIADLAKAHLEATKKLEAEREAHAKTKEDSVKLLDAAAKKLEQIATPTAASTKGHKPSLLQRLKGHIKRIFGQDEESLKRKAADAKKHEEWKKSVVAQANKSWAANPIILPPRTK